MPLLKKWQLRRVLAVCSQKKREVEESEESDDSSEVRRNSKITRMEQLLTSRPNFLAMNLVQLWNNVLLQRRQYEEQRNQLQTLTQQITELRAEVTSIGQLLRTVEQREEQNNGNTFDGFHLLHLRLMSIERHIPADTDWLFEQFDAEEELQRRMAEP
jgi:cell division protein FtsB